jgi:hypothetical protein
VLMHSSNHYPLGNCDSPKLETSSDYLTRLGAVSNRTSPPSSLFALTDSARTLPEELVNPASPPSVFQLDFRGAWPTSLTLPFPGHPGVSLRRLPAQVGNGAAHQAFRRKADMHTCADDHTPWVRLTRIKGSAES